MLKHKSTFWLAALITAWSVDFLFWEKTPGISFPLFIAIALGAMFITAFREGKHPAGSTYWLAGAGLVFSVLTVIRMEPFTRVLNHLGAFFALGLLVITLRGGRWSEFNLADYILEGLKFMLGCLILPVNLFSSGKQTRGGENQGITAGEDQHSKRGSFWKKTLPYLRGALIAAPILILLTALLAAADPIFAEQVKALDDWVHPETFFRGMFILILTYLFGGVLLHGLTKSLNENLTGEENSWLPRFLGFIESAVVLVSVNALFIFFLSIQFRYFFGGEKNISGEGFTYAEYARRGFGELLAVAFLTLALFIILNIITRKDQKKQRYLYTAFTTVLTVLIGLILFSSLQRLMLYENAYGFTRLRAYSHLCIFWIGALFLGILILEFLGAQRRFTLAALLAAAGLVVTMSAVNVDGFITSRNLERALGGEDLDIPHLMSLSPDSVPPLLDHVEDTRLSPSYREALRGVLACQEEMIKEQLPSPWQSYHWSRARASKLLHANQKLWEDVHTWRDDYERCCIPGNGEEEEFCTPYPWD